MIAKLFVINPLNAVGVVFDPVAIGSYSAVYSACVERATGTGQSTIDGVWNQESMNVHFDTACN